MFHECRNTPYTHVHILTHGDLSETSRDSYGLVLRGPDDSSEVVSGEQFASALTSVGRGRIHRPTVVTVASCDSGNVGTLILPGASFAHALHQAGIPLVVASQFPLSKEGSVPLATALYEGLLWGKNPLVLLQQLRAELHARYTASWHDWASLVVYEALPQALPDQLEALRYHQAKRAIQAVLERIDIAVQIAADPLTNASRVLEPLTNASLKELDEKIESILGRLPLDGQYAAECIGHQGQFAQASRPGGVHVWSHRAAGGIHTSCSMRPTSTTNGRRRGCWSSTPGRRNASPRSIGCSSRSNRWRSYSERSLTRDDGPRRACLRSLYLDHQKMDERAWAHGSLAELYLIRLGDPDLTEEQRKEFSDNAVEQARELARLYPRRDEFPVRSTRSQFQRYVDWWGAPQFESGLQERGLASASRIVGRRVWRDRSRKAPRRHPAAAAAGHQAGCSPRRLVQIPANARTHHHHLPRLDQRMQ